ncbi:MAG: tRNA pseudouridine(38-40) synthase TruA [Bacteriovoracaceae bacterium]|jgi:tRNA pseudouridine38-40 synthase|nr:tRNA pseudouridine(38-40) synthase TruA [Bacteriovoracaceae bacterium]
MKSNLCYYKISLSFKGTSFLGWQKQKDFRPTVQEEIEKACSKIFKSNNIHTIGSGRTDTGVHGIKLICRLAAPFMIECEALKRALNTHLNKDIRVICVEESNGSFRPTNDAISRTYKYLFSDREMINPFENEYIAKVKGKLDLEKMKEACSFFIGDHDFVNYMCVGTDVLSTKREILSCNVLLHKESFHGMMGQHYSITIKGSGFLKQMIRLIVATVWSYAQGKITKEQIQESLSGVKLDQKLAPVAPACGLYKIDVQYKP